MSGNPGDGPGSSAVNFVWYPWPDDSMALLDRQWTDAIELWRDLGAYALAHGVERLAFELHPLHLVYNVPTLDRMRGAVGPVIGANVGPSHLFWRGRAARRHRGPRTGRSPRPPQDAGS
jgi:sugar phosphate isomerase/epimerase